MSKLYCADLVVIVMLPVEVKQLGCVMSAAGGFGVAGALLMVTEVAGESQPFPSRILTWYVPGDKPDLVFEAWKEAPLSKLYCTPELGLVTVIVPVEVKQLGCPPSRTNAVGAVGRLSCGVVNVLSVKQPSEPFHTRTV